MNLIEGKGKRWSSTGTFSFQKLMIMIIIFLILRKVKIL